MSDTDDTRPSGEVRAREFWLNIERDAIGGSWHSKPIDKDWVHVIEHSAYDKLRRERDELRDGIERQKDFHAAERRSFAQEVENSKESIRLLVIERESYHAENKRLESEVERLRGENEALRLEVSALDRKIVRHVNDNAELRAENIKLKEQLSLHSVFAALPFQEENEKLRASLKDVQHEMHLQSITIHSTREELAELKKIHDVVCPFPDCGRTFWFDLSGPDRRKGTWFVEGKPKPKYTEIETLLTAERQKVAKLVECLEKIGNVDHPSASDKTSYIVMLESICLLAREALADVKED
jgi:regulator of replication initiation timing